MTIGGAAFTHALRFLRHGEERQASFLAIRTERRQRMEIERRTKLHVPDDGPVVRERGPRRTNLVAHLQNLRQLEIAHDRRRCGRREIMPQTERMADLVRHDVPQVVVLLFQISVHHGLGQDEHVRMENPVPRRDKLSGLVHSVATPRHRLRALSQIKRLPAAISESA
jgi:hypothetical protein